MAAACLQAAGPEAFLAYRGAHFYVPAPRARLARSVAFQLLGCQNQPNMNLRQSAL